MRKGYTIIHKQNIFEDQSIGRDGESAYDIALRLGLTDKTEEEWAASLSATVEVVQTQTLLPGQPARVENVGTEKNAKLRFFIPQGQDGLSANINTINVIMLEPDDLAYAIKSGPVTDITITFGIPRGHKGDQGIQGIQGIQGENGLIGPPGIQGIQGLPGADGAPGPPGDSGLDGKDGAVPEYRYAQNGSFTVPPSVVVTDRAPVGWTLGVPNDGPGNYTWEIVTLINADNTLYQNWSTPKRTTGTPGANGVDGEDGTNGIDGLPGIPGTNGNNGDGYEFQFIVIERNQPPPDVNNNSLNWLAQAPASIGNTQTLYSRSRVKNGDGTFGPWQGPIKYTGDDGESIQGPSMAYRGDWSAIKEYSGSEYVVDVVKYLPNGRGYIARSDAGLIPVGTVPTDTNYWNEFTIDVDAIFTDFLFAYSGYIQNLTVGQLQTATENERYTVGFKPSDSGDPTLAWSKHGQRTYYASGRPMIYSGLVATYSYKDDTTIKTLNNEAAIIMFKDEPNSPPSLVISASGLGGISHVVPPSDPGFVQITMFILPWIPISENVALPLFHAETSTKAPTEAFRRLKDTYWCGQWRGPYGYDSRLGYKGANTSQKTICHVKYSAGTYTYKLTPENAGVDIPDGWYLKSFGTSTPPGGNGGSDAFREFNLQAELVRVVGGVQNFGGSGGDSLTRIFKSGTSEGIPVCDISVPYIVI